MQSLFNVNVLSKYNVYYTSVVYTEKYAYHMSKLSRYTKLEHLFRQHPEQETEAPFPPALCPPLGDLILTSNILTDFACVQTLY